MESTSAHQKNPGYARVCVYVCIFKSNVICVMRRVQALLTCARTSVISNLNIVRYFMFMDDTCFTRPSSAITIMKQNCTYRPYEYHSHFSFEQEKRRNILSPFSPRAI